jgi:hypothetical protein
MHLASDYIHPYRDAGGCPALCRVRIYLPDDERDVPVVICSELPSYLGGSVTNSAEAIAAGVIRAEELTPLWCESSTGPRRAQKDRRSSIWSFSPVTRLRRGLARRGYG